MPKLSETVKAEGLVQVGADTFITSNVAPVVVTEVEVAVQETVPHCAMVAARRYPDSVVPEAMVEEAEMLPTLSWAVT